MAITHDDLSIKNHQAANISSRLAFFLMGLSVFCDLIGFVLCLAGESSRSEATWIIITIQDSKGYRCYYSGNGKAPLIFAVAAFLLFAVAMFTGHAYMLVAIRSSSSPELVVWPASNYPIAISPATKAPRLACILFLIIWICFAIAEILLMIIIGVESGHLHDWTKPRLICPEIRPGLFATIGVIGPVTIFLGIALYHTALRTQRLHQEETMGSHQHLQPTAPPQELSVMRAYQSRASGETLSLNKTSILV